MKFLKFPGNDLSLKKKKGPDFKDPGQSNPFATTPQHHKHPDTKGSDTSKGNTPATRVQQSAQVA